MTDVDFAKILKHAPLDCIGPAMVEVLVARGARRAGLARLVSALMHRCFDEGGDAATVPAPGAELPIYEQLSKH